MTTFFQWRRFNFFDLVKDVDEGEVEKTLKSSSGELTCTSSGRGHLILGDSSGHLHFVNRHLKVHSMRAFQRKVYLIHQMKQSGIVTVVGEDEPAGVCPYLKVYNLDKPDKSGYPSLLRLSRLVLPAGRVSEPVALSASENQTLLAIGFANGMVVLQRGDLTRERGIKQKSLMDGDANNSSSASSVTGLSFRSLSKTSHLFVSTVGGVFCFNVTVKDREGRSCLDNLGCERPGLAIPVENLSDANFVTGRNDAVYCYTTEGRGQCYAFDGRKVALHWLRSYLVVISVEQNAASSSSVSPSKVLPTTSSSSELDSPTSNMHLLTVFDVQNKFVAFAAPVKPIKAVLSEWGLLFAVTEDNRLFQLTEKDIQAKLELLFKKNFYDIAVKIAKTQQYDEDGLVDIFKQHGDHLYTKNDYSAAIENYSKTIGHLEPSYVIRKFMDAHKIHHLTDYLQALHSKNCATGEHTTLLLNCYTKLKDRPKLEEFAAKDSVDYDVDVAIKVCRQAGYNDLALNMAKRHRKHEWYLRLQIEDGHNYSDAIAYIGTLDFEDAEMNMKKYGHALMQKIPDETTELLKILCTDYKPSNAPLVSERMLAGGGNRAGYADDNDDDVDSANPDDFLHLFSGCPAKMIDFIEYMIKTRPSENEGVYNTLLEHYMRSLNEMRDEEDGAAAASKRKSLEERVMQILRSEDAKYDVDLALVHCQLHEFRKGFLFLLEDMGLYSQMLQLHLETGDVAAVIQTCRAFGPQNPRLWVEALTAVTKEGDATKSQIEEILRMVEKNNLLSYVEVIDIFDRAPSATLGQIREYVLRSLSDEDRRLAEDRAKIAQYEEDSAKLRELIERKKTENFVFKLDKCQACSHNVEFPAVFFLCNHQYHKHCFQSYSDRETECPACQPENKKIMDIVQSQQKARDQHDAFQHQMETAENAFTVVADAFSRGMFRQPLEVAELNHQMETVHIQQPESSTSLSDHLTAASGAGAEARIRGAEGGFHSHQGEVSEARLRAADRRPQVQADASEGRLRSQQGSLASAGVPVSDARMRQREGSVAGSLEANLTRSAALNQPQGMRQQQQYTRLTPHAVPRREDIPSRHPNPFSSAAAAAAAASASTNPFGDDGDDDDFGENNPFVEDATAASRARGGGGGGGTNPFGEGDDDDYDSSLNPFATK